MLPLRSSEVAKEKRQARGPNGDEAEAPGRVRMPGTRDLPAPLEQARAQIELGAALRRANRRAEARKPLRAGMDGAQCCGAIALASRARDELRATEARPRRLMLSGADALTPSELRVATMAADGLRNREIAQALFVTVKTVDMHLSRVFRKLDIHRRADVRAALNTRGG